MDEQDEESVYVVMELEGAQLPAPGSVVHLKGMHGDAPELRLPDGSILRGAFEETLGSQMVFAEGAAAGDAPRTVRLLCHTDKRIRFAAAPAAAPLPEQQQQQQQEEAAAAEGG